MEFKRKYIIEGLLSFVMTENCNFLCDHCLRGEKRPNKITKEVIDEFLTQVDIRGRINLTGGEPLSNSKGASYLLSQIYELGNRPEEVKIVTNGSMPSRRLNEVVETMAEVGANPKIIVSNDPSHLDQRENLHNRIGSIESTMEEYREIMTNNGFDPNEHLLLMEFDANALPKAIGRAANLEKTHPGWDNISFSQWITQDRNIIYGRLQVQPDGRITAGCDMSWDDRDKHYGEEYNILNHPLKRILKYGLKSES